MGDILVELMDEQIKRENEQRDSKKRLKDTKEKS